MEPAMVMMAPLPTLPACGFVAISAPATFFGGGGGAGGRFSAGGGGGSGRGGEGGRGAGDESAGSGAVAAAVAALGETEVEGDDPDAIVLHPEVTAATIDFEKAIAFVWTTPEAKAAEDWKKELGEKLANHLSTCGFQSHLQDEGDSKQTKCLGNVYNEAHEVLPSNGP